MDGLFAALLKEGLPFGLLAAAVMWFNNLVGKKDAQIEAKDKEKDDLHKEMRQILEEAHKRSTDAINNNTLVMQSLKETIHARDK